MKILFTGCSESSIRGHDERPAPANFLTADEPLFDSLARAGHAVERRGVRPGEDLSGYDAAFLGVRDPSLLAGIDGAPGSFYAAGALMNTSTQVILNIAAPTLHEMRDGCRRMSSAREWRTSVARGLFPRGPLPLPGDWAKDCAAAAWAIVSGEWPANWMGVLRGFPWMDLDRYAAVLRVSSSQLRMLDPSYAAVERATVALAGANRSMVPQWSFATLADHSGWLSSIGLHWPVVTHDRRHRSGEDEVIREMACSWGALAFPYAHDGGGWWRSRTVYAAIVGTVLAGAPADGAAIGPAYEFAPAAVEALSEGELRELAKWQCETLLPRLWSMEQFDAATAALIKE